MGAGIVAGVYLVVERCIWQEMLRCMMLRCMYSRSGVWGQAGRKAEMVWMGEGRLPTLAERD